MNKYEDRRTRLQHIFQDTMAQVEHDTELAAAASRMIDETVVYANEISGIEKCQAKSDGTQISVVEDTTFSCARKMTSSGKVAVLNFANAIHPGGGVTHGAMAQEECLCRSSNLYAGLTCKKMIEQYYRKNKRVPDTYGSDIVAYHPGVTVFKDDEMYANPLERADWFQVDVITCAAPRIGEFGRMSNDEMYRIHYNRGRRIIETAIVNGVDVLVLGAFGCGAFRNDPEVVAKAYKELLMEEEYAKYFKKVIFAIKKDRNDVKGNYFYFRKVMEA